MVFQVGLTIAFWVVVVGFFIISQKSQERRQEARRKEEFLFLKKTLNALKNGNKSEKVDALVKVSKILEDCNTYYRDEFESIIDSTTQNLDLEGANLSNAKLVNIYLNDSNLRDANLENSKLIHTSFTWVDFENANLKNSSLTFSKFVGVNLLNADLEGAYLFGVKFDNTNLLGANLKGVNLQRADISNSLIKLSDIDPQNSLISIYDVEIKGEKLTPPNFKGAVYDCKTKFPKDFNPENEGMIEVDSIP
ncbi:pentapeptide repeat-containing protein [Thermodesulfobacteriota bacterium]